MLPTHPNLYIFDRKSGYLRLEFGRAIKIKTKTINHLQTAGFWIFTIFYHEGFIAKLVWKLQISPGYRHQNYNRSGYLHHPLW
ncbi:uncharacterized protein DFL_009823 [Arthrobotrys flagrans]|uniref:Uncharacterized protein n=1 Tax=Arthrobotrys flagrans TaxID=97331 RepID=A0A436ZST1_ARTFL|nr:hypothetical protein DFL_009823 [Arthrobotrys flagrans]